MTNEASVVVDGESTVDMPEEHGTITVDASDDEQESCENTIHYNLIMPEQEDDLQQSMLNNYLSGYCIYNRFVLYSKPCI